MKSSSQAVSFMSILMLLLLLAPSSEAAIACSDVIKDLRPCLSYLQSGSGKPPATCCAGVSALASAAKTTADKQTACNCIKNATSKVSVKPELAKALPSNCGISLSFTVSPNVDCSKYYFY
ncbi:non-specific lipid-transfer protein 8-like [Cornus florida]|uniref:non-specific lipid-transfer protein 8-like n=1 Tax=Cornus florida TaxID=4283 RepID=UPI00289D6D0A|nr:non-specific lipid-transfer protein 8-like [Cornus florida]